MEHKRIKWGSLPAQFITENSEILPDITFKFTDGEVAAHKMVLGMVSKVFRNMFFVHNTVDKSAKEIVMEGATRPAFKIMIDAMYNAKSIEESLQGSSVHEIFDVLYWVTKYEIPDLVLAVKDCLSSLTILEENVLEVAEDAMEYLTTFEEDAQNVLLSCATFLKSKLTYKLLLEFVAKNGDKITTVHKLIVLMDEMTPPICNNCNSDPCLNGVGVEKSQCREGLKVAHNSLAISVAGERKLWRSDLTYLTGEILKIEEGDGNEVEVNCKYAFQNNSDEKSDFRKFDVVRNGVIRFVFRCK